ncbi:tetratricopeptide repeat protein [Kitasatospora sp. NPDC059088]|uniref:tetratricopeptide repeat protein n=1 Tax=Kitasatospora sp. NPDC059088 TaxID=3346722 RepID=UPI00369B5D97
MSAAGPTPSVSLSARRTTPGNSPQRRRRAYERQQCARFGPRHPITLAAELNYGYALIVSGHRSQALSLVRDTLAAIETTHGPDHPKTLAARSLLSRALGELSGLHEDAVAQARLVADTRARVLGADHPWTTWSLERLQGRLRAAGWPGSDDGPRLDP